MKKIIIILLVSLGLQTQAQVTYCDSISYTTLPQQTLTVSGSASSLLNMVDSIIWDWTACNSALCYSESGAIATFQSILPTDTIKLCYDAFIYFDTMTYVCTYCDSLIYDGSSWVLFNMGNPTTIKEIQFSTVNNSKIYDLLGRELDRVPVGKMYIRNNKLYISK